MTDENKDEEPNAVVWLRQINVISQTELATQAEVSPQTLRRLETGKTIRFAQARRIAAALGVPPDGLYSLPAAKMYHQELVAARLATRGRLQEERAMASEHQPVQQALNNPPGGAPPVPPPDLAGQTAPIPPATPAPAQQAAPQPPPRPADDSALLMALPQMFDPDTIREAVAAIQNFLLTEPGAPRGGDGTVEIDTFRREGLIRMWATNVTYAIAPDEFEDVVVTALRVVQEIEGAPSSEVETGE